MVQSVSPSAPALGAYDLFDELPDGVLVTTRSGRVEAANTAFLALVEREASGIVGRPLESIVAPEDMLQFLGVEEMFGNTTHDASIIFTAPDGSPRRLLVCSTPSRDLRNILFTARAAGAVQEELATTTRWAAAEQDRAAELAHARDALSAKNEALRSAQEETSAAYAKLQGEVATRERLEKDLRLAQKLESIGQLAAGVAHEINTPMQYVGDNVAFLTQAFSKVCTYIDIAQRASAGETAKSLDEVRSVLESSKIQLKLKFLLENVPKALQDSKSGIEHVSNIVRAMKSFAHADQDEKTAGDVNRAILDTLMVAQSEYKTVASIETELAELPPVTCFLGRLNQVFLNLIVNAAHAIGDSQRAEGKIKISSRAEGNLLIVTIADNGSGIPEHVQHKIFDPFFTTKPVGKGTGQGLSLARDIIVDAHGGTLSFETAPGVGTTFFIRLPIDGQSKPVECG